MRRTYRRSEEALPDSLHGRARQPVVRVEARREGKEPVVSCRDEGIGIEPQYAERVFAIFQRLRPKETYEGTGIGLVLTCKIVEEFTR
jgi:light-regulated signal transduction histidine kinase (bacteriophytochrome)